MTDAELAAEARRIFAGYPEMNDAEVDLAVRKFVGLLFQEQGAEPEPKPLPPDYWETAQ